jgi:hypothetical protein
MTNQEIIEYSKLITDALYVIILSLSGFVVGYIFGRNDQNL